MPRIAASSWATLERVNTALGCCRKTLSAPNPSIVSQSAGCLRRCVVWKEARAFVSRVPISWSAGPSVTVSMPSNGSLR